MPKDCKVPKAKTQPKRSSVRAAKAKAKAKGKAQKADASEPEPKRQKAS